MFPRTLGNDQVEYIDKDYEKMPEHLVMSWSKKDNKTAWSIWKYTRDSLGTFPVYAENQQSNDNVSTRTIKKNIPGWKVTKSDMNVCET